MTRKNKKHGNPATTTAVDPTEWQCITVLVICVVVFFGQHLLGNAFLWEDILHHSFPSGNFAASTLAEGTFPLWNPYTFNGMPFFADIQTAVLYLPLTALAFFVKDGRLAFYWLQLVIILHYVLAAVTMFYLARSFQLRNLPSLLAGLAFAFSGFMIVHAIHQQVVTMVAWYPLILLLFRKSLREPGWFWTIITALLLGHTVLTGFPQLILYFYFFLFLFFAFELLTTYPFKELVSQKALLVTAKAGTVVVCSVALIAVQLLPTLELAPLSLRAAITYQKATEGQMSWGNLLTLVIPKLFGQSQANNYNYWGPGVYWYFWETCIYQGAIPLFLALVSIVTIKKNKYVSFFLGLSVFAVLFGLGDNFFLHKLFYDFVPRFETFRVPARMTVFLGLSVALLSGFALQYLLFGAGGAGIAARLRKIVLAGWGGALLLWIGIVSGSMSGMFPFMRDPKIIAYLTTEAHVAALMFSLSALAVFLLLKPSRWTRTASLGLMVILFVDMYVFGAAQNRSAVNPEEYFNRAGNIIQFVKQQGTNEFFRVNTRNEHGMIMDRNQGMLSRIYQQEGYTPLALQRVFPPMHSNDKMLDLMNVKYKTVTDTARNGLRLVASASYRPRAFIVYDVRTVQSESELLALLASPEFDHRTTAVIDQPTSLEFPAPAGTPTGSVSIVAYHNEEISLRTETSHDGLLVLSEIYYPGWKAYVDDVETEILRTDYNLRGIPVKKGSKNVIVRFEPQSFASGLKISFATLAILLVGLVVTFKQRNRQSSHTPTEG